MYFQAQKVPDDHLVIDFARDQSQRGKRPPSGTRPQKRKANLSISTKKLDYWLFDDQRSLKLRYVYYNNVPLWGDGRTPPAGDRASPQNFGVPDFFGHFARLLLGISPDLFWAFPEFKILWGSPTLSLYPCGPREHVMLRDIRNQLRSDRC